MKTFATMGVLIFNDDGKPRIFGSTYDLTDENQLAAFISISTQVAYISGQQDAKFEIRKSLGISGIADSVRIEA